MTYVVTDNCIKCKYMDCVEVCPVDCFYAGENMLETMGRMIPGYGWLLPIPFYFMELLVGLVQAMVFMLLTAVFTLLICQHEEGEQHPASSK